MVSDITGESYDDKLQAAGLTTRERRERVDMIETFKTMSGINRVERDGWFRVQEEEEEEIVQATRFNTMVVSREAVRRKKILKPERANLHIRRQFFTARALGGMDGTAERQYL